MPKEINRSQVQSLVEGALNWSRCFRQMTTGEDHIPGAISLPAQTHRNGRRQAARPDSSGDRLLLGHRLRRVSESRVAARELWVRRGLRLCGRQAGLG